MSRISADNTNLQDGLSVPLSRTRAPNDLRSKSMKRHMLRFPSRSFLLLGFGVAAAAAHAKSEVYLCVDQICFNGVKEC